MTRNRQAGPGRTVFFILLLSAFVTGGSSYAFDIDAWLSGVEGRRYAPVEDRLIRLFEETEGRPEISEILFSKLQEGAAKRIPPGTLAGFLIREKESLVSTREVLVGSGLWGPASEEARTVTLKAVNETVRSGLSPEVISSAVGALAETGRDLEALNSAVLSLFKIFSATDLSALELAEIGSALGRSELSPEDYRRLPSYFLKSGMYRIPEQQMSEMIQQVLSAGGRLIDIEQALQTRMPKR